MTLTWKALAFFKRDLTNDLSYKFSFAFQMADILVGVGCFYFLARVLGEAAFRKYGPFPFILIGIAVNGYMTTYLICFAQTIRGNQPLGTLKMVLVTPTSPVAFILYSSLYPAVRAALDITLYLLLGAIIGLSLVHANVPAMLVLFLLSVGAFGSIGILSASFTLIFKKGDPLLWLFTGLSGLLGGAYYPIEVLPRLLRYAAQLLPITHVLIGMRTALLGGVSIAQLLPQIGTLGLFDLVGLPLSLFAFSRGVRWMRAAGTTSHF